MKDLKQGSKLAILLYLVSIVDALVLLIFLLQDYSNEKLFIFLINCASLISSSSVSIAATILYFNYFKDNERVTENKIIGIVFSLSIHLTIELLILRTELSSAVKAGLGIFLLVLSFVFAIFIFKNYQLANKYSNKLKKSDVPEALRATAEKVATGNIDGNLNGDEYELGGEADEI